MISSTFIILKLEPELDSILLYFPLIWFISEAKFISTKLVEHYQFNPPSGSLYLSLINLNNQIIKSL